MDQFKTICRAHAVISPDHQDTLLQFLHDLGVVLNFSDLALRDTNVINPAWVTDGVYRLINSPAIAESGGALDTSLLSELLDPSRHPSEKHNFIVELMKKFELCYSIDTQRLLLPVLLPVEQPTFRFPTQDVVALSTSIRIFAQVNIAPVHGQIAWRY
jgi:hypothetical protein